mmetsp:Transcript_3181/g.4230  ORF Transcript_3181/g.4230 Transcript_3181/m.4230 type:complete len:302 (-) Transcript_3181:189-1094(-)
MLSIKESNADIIVALYQKENLYVYRTFSHTDIIKTCSNGRSPTSALHPDPAPPLLYGSIRRKICEWMYQVVDYYQYDRKLTLIGMNYFDRFLDNKINDLNYNVFDKEEMQLIGLTSLYVACKVHGCSSVLDSFVKLSSGKFLRSDVERMEVKLLFTLRWLLNPPLPQVCSAFLTRQVLRNSQNHESLFKMVLEVSNYVIETLVLNEHYSHEMPSVIGCAATLISFNGMKKSLTLDLRERFFNEIEDLTFISKERILVVESEINDMLRPSNMHFSLQEIHQCLDPNGLIYENFTGPPDLLPT